MANYETFELARNWLCWEVPAPSQIGDLGKALAAAEFEYRRHHGLGPEEPLTDGWCQVYALDDRLRIQFEVEATKR